MGVAQEPSEVLLFCAILASDSVVAQEAQRLFEAKFGAPRLSVGPIPFDFSSYYNKEMGEQLIKGYYLYDCRIKRDDLAAIKNFTNNIEAQLGTTAGSRRANLDPGYVSRDKLVLASTKDFAHRIYLGAGIFAEVTLHFSRGRCRHFSWTYPDYRIESVNAMLLEGRTWLEQSR